jgi:pimeloyl-ACP methyl ester carboxylesterase
MARFISKDGTEIAYEQAGSGPALIMVDGAMSSRSFGPMKALSDRLANDLTVYTYDRRGRGESGDTPPYAAECEIEDIEALIDEAGGTASLFGISSGAVLALKAAARLGDKVGKLAMYEAPFSSGDRAGQASARFSSKLTELLDEGKRSDAVALFLAGINMPVEMIQGMRQGPLWPVMEALAPTLVYDDAIMGDGSLPVDDVKVITVPTLVLVGGASPAFIHEAGEALANALPGAQRATLEGQTHQVSPEALVPALLTFLKGTPTRD